MTYLLTFACYGARWHAHEWGSAGLARCVPGTPIPEAGARTRAPRRDGPAQGPYELDWPRRELVLLALRETCAFQNWRLLAAHVRRNRVRVVVDAEDRPEKVLNAFKTHAARRLNQAALDRARRRRWSRNGSARYLWRRGQVEEAIADVAEVQGESTAVYVSQGR